MKSILYSERLILKELGAPDAEAVLDYLRRNREVLGPWERTKEPEYYTLEYQRELLHQESEKIASGDLCKWWIFRQEEPGRIIGSVVLSNIVRGAFQSCHLGYGLDGKEHRKGYMTEAVRRVTLYAFAESGLYLHRIEANIIPRNAASLRVAEKCGFYHEGLAYKYLYINGAWEDHIHMVLRNEAME
ncbi:N-acetyltransferase [Paenibacillus oralis]|uniref:N-acetyltransferase n=1 Tax=Paenibacillus oralis TaxID=2490856 RepID=A0A3P3TU29_9BACL|nr:GNAT family protein [Paenibacillus oralis]RRJ61661.1 N-acetyltransferase [Paenibacillus oralis]